MKHRFCLGQICPECGEAFPVNVYIMAFDEDDIGRGNCAACQAPLEIRRRWVPKYDIHSVSLDKG